MSTITEDSTTIEASKASEIAMDIVKKSFSSKMEDCCALPKCVLRKGQNSIELKACGACTIPYYCCKEHQVEHFKNGGHKYVCKGRKSGNPLTFQECSDKAISHHNNKEYKDALTYYSAMIELTERSVGVFHPQIANLLSAMVQCLKLSGQYDEAIALLQRMLVVYEYDQAATETVDVSVLSDKNAMLQVLKETKINKQAFATLGRLAETYMEAGYTSLAKELCEKIVEEAASNYGDSSYERGQALLALGTCFESSGEFDKAEENLLLAARLEGFGSSSEKEIKAKVCHLFFNLALIQISLDKKSEAISNLQNYIKILKENGLKDNDPQIMEANDYLKKLKV